MPPVTSHSHISVTERTHHTIIVDPLQRVRDQNNSIKEVRVMREEGQLILA